MNEEVPFIYGRRVVALQEYLDREQNPLETIVAARGGLKWTQTH